jgi:uridine kinase
VSIRPPAPGGIDGPRGGRATVVEQVVERLLADHPGDRPRRVGVDGITAAGKTTWARELTGAIRARGRSALHLSTDDFHHPRARRHRQGRTSAGGYYADAYDFAALAEHVLRPLGPGGDRRIRTRIHDLQSDQRIDTAPVTVPAEGLVIVDGTFLQRAELDGLWDEVIYIDTSPRKARARAAERDGALFGGAAAVEQIYRMRYHAACALYAEDADPIRRAGIVIDNNDLDHPVLRRIG